MNTEHVTFIAPLPAARVQAGCSPSWTPTIPAALPGVF